jgi:hypothetical protein
MDQFGYGHYGRTETTESETVRRVPALWPEYSAATETRVIARTDYSDMWLREANRYGSIERHVEHLRTAVQATQRQQSLLGRLRPKS